VLLLSLVFTRSHLYFIGGTGDGKSTVINIIRNANDALTGSTPCSVTNSSGYYVFKNRALIDTIGLNDNCLIRSEISDSDEKYRGTTKALLNIFDSIQEFKKFTSFVFVRKCDNNRITSDMEDAIKVINGIMGDFPPNWILHSNFCHQDKCQICKERLKKNKKYWDLLLPNYEEAYSFEKCSDFTAGCLDQTKISQFYNGFLDTHDYVNLTLPKDYQQRILQKDYNYIKQQIKKNYCLNLDGMMKQAVDVKEGHLARKNKLLNEKNSIRTSQPLYETCNCVYSTTWCQRTHEVWVGEKCKRFIGIKYKCKNQYRTEVYDDPACVAAQGEAFKTCTYGCQSAKELTSKNHQILIDKQVTEVDDAISSVERDIAQADGLLEDLVSRLKRCDASV